MRSITNEVVRHPSHLLLHMLPGMATLILVSSTVSLSVGSKNNEAPPRSAGVPNIVLILVDDLGWADVGCYGSRFTLTPHIDRLAAEGMIFTDAYAAAPICSPTRASLMTGRSPARLRLTNVLNQNNIVEDSPLRPASVPSELDASETTIAEVLRDAGYLTGMIGKWHLGPWTLEGAKDRRGFDWVVGKPSQYARFRTAELENRFPLIRQGAPADEPYFTDVLTDRAVEFIHQNRGRKFFLYLSHFAVHIPVFARSDKIEKYRKRLATDPPGADELPNPHYAAMVESIDDSTGRVLAAIDTAGIEDNTLVIFFSDNGGLATTYEASGHDRRLADKGQDSYNEFVPATLNGPLRLGKGFLYEGGIREPCIVRWPGVVKPESVCREPITSDDFFPTLAEVAGVDVRRVVTAGLLDGLSIVPLLKDAAAPLDRDVLGWHFPHFSNEGGRPSSALRHGRWKLIEHLETGDLEVYDLEKDLGESTNLADQDPELTKHLYHHLTQWRTEVNAEMPTRK